MKSLPEGTESTMNAKEPTPPPDGVVRPDPPPAPPQQGDVIHWGPPNAPFRHIATVTVDERGNMVSIDPPVTALDRIATALERLVELAEQGEPEMDVDIEIDADGKLMHVTAECEPHIPNGPTALGAYVLAHDPDAAARAAKTWWSENGHEGITGVKVNYDD